MIELKQKLPTDGLTDLTIVYTALGKVNAAISLMAVLKGVKLGLLKNYGTAGRSELT